MCPCPGNADHRTCSAGVLRTAYLPALEAPIGHHVDVTNSASSPAPFARVAGALLGITALLSAMVVTAAPASAHARLESSSPTDGSTLTATPPEIMLRFNEPVKDGLNEVSVTTGSADVAEGEVEVEGQSVYQPVALDMKPGKYTVKYKVVSEDGHPVSGTYSFTYAPPEGDTGASGEPSEEASASETSKSSTSSSSTSSTEEGSETSGPADSPSTSEDSPESSSESRDSAAGGSEETSDSGPGMSPLWIAAGAGVLVVLLAVIGLVVGSRRRR